MSNSDLLLWEQPRIALLPSAGMGHLTPFLRLAAMLASNNCLVTLISIQPTVSEAESTHISSFLSTHPRIKHLAFHLLPYDASKCTTNDPFFIQFESISQSIHRLHPLLSSSSPPLSAIVCDFIAAACVGQISSDLSIPHYVFATTSTRFFSFMAYFPFLELQNSSKLSCSDSRINIPGLVPLPASSIPPPFFDQNHPLTAVITRNAPYLSKAKGVLLNIFEWFDSETIAALNSGKVLSSLPAVLPIGPLEPYNIKQNHSSLPWLDGQPAESVVYVSFGSRTTMSRDQIIELGNGLKGSSCRFLWVLKTNKVDKDDKEEPVDLLGESFLESTKTTGLIMKGWLNQVEILEHPAIGGFLSHCGWNSVMEAAQRGVPILAWPQHGDQKINAESVENAGLGLWPREWGWGGEKLVKGEVIGEMITQLMFDANLRAKARKVRREAEKATNVGGSSTLRLMKVIEQLKPEGRNF